MTSGKLKNGRKAFIILLQVGLCYLSLFATAQPPKKFQRRDIIDVGNGQKAEIIQCRGEGPLEECDVIYYTKSRAQGTRVWQNANRLREDERAAKLIKDLAIGNANSLSAKSVSYTKETGGEEFLERENTMKDALQNQIPPLPNRSSKLLDTAGTETNKDVALQKEIRRIDSITRTKVDTFKLSLQREIEVQDSIANASDTSESEVRLEKEIVDSNVAEPVATPKMDLEIPAPANLPKAAIEKEVQKETITEPSLLNVGDNTPIKPLQKETPARDSTSFIKADAPAKTLPKDQQQLDSASRLKTNTLQPALHTEIQSIDRGKSESATILKPTIKEEALRTDTNFAVAANTPPPLPKENKLPITVSKEVLNGTKVELPSTSEPLQNLADTKKDTAKMPSDQKNQAIETGVITAIHSDKISDSEVSAATASNAETPNNAEKSSIKKEKEAVANTQEKPTALADMYTRTAEVNVGGSWEKALIVDKESEYLYKVHFEGKDAKDDEWVAISQIRNMDSVRKIIPVYEGKVNSTSKVTGSNNNNINCSFAAPAPPVFDADKFSAKLAKRKIYESYLDESKTKNASARVGLTFLSFKTEEPFVNTVTVSATQSLVFKYASAPAGAMVYPVKANYIVCEQLSGKTTSKTVNSSYACFRNKNGIWTCTTDR